MMPGKLSTVAKLRAFTNGAVVVVAPNLDGAIALHNQYCQDPKRCTRPWREIPSAEQIRVGDGGEFELIPVDTLIEALVEADTEPLVFPIERMGN